MPRFTTVLPARNDEPRIARALESLRACDDVLIIDNGSTDRTAVTARQFGARMIQPQPAGEFLACLRDARFDWILFLQATEAVGESLEASLYEFGLSPAAPSQTFAIGLLEETPEGWKYGPPETRLVHRSHARWAGKLPASDASAEVLEGYLLRLRWP